jgi:hypothetical protein
MMTSVLIALLLMPLAIAWHVGGPRTVTWPQRSMFMRDGSTAAVYFQIGDKVKITEDVMHQPKSKPAFSSKGLEGRIKDIWEKCEIDPHCCCAELATDAPIEVEFENDLYYGTGENNGIWTGHFAADEIQKVVDKSNKN